MGGDGVWYASVCCGGGMKLCGRVVLVGVVVCDGACNGGREEETEDVMLLPAQHGGGEMNRGFDVVA